MAWIFNLSFQQGKFLKKFEIVKIILIHKKGDPKDVNYCRPISLKLSFSKILEKIAHNRLSCFLKKLDLFSKFQFGFLEYHSTELAVSCPASKIANAIENGLITIGIFFELSKIFVTINHQILFAKLHHYDIKGNAHSWFASYSLNRQQYTEYGGAKSTFQVMQHCLPQGSILELLFF